MKINLPLHSSFRYRSRFRNTAQCVSLVLVVTTTGITSDIIMMTVHVRNADLGREIQVMDLVKAPEKTRER